MMYLKSVFLKKSEIILLSWANPDTKKLRILLMITSWIGMVPMILGNIYDLVCLFKPSILREQIFQAVHNSSTAGSSSLHRWQPYSEEHWLWNKVTFICLSTGLNLFKITFVLTFIPLITFSRLIILCADRKCGPNAYLI